MTNTFGRYREVQPQEYQGFFGFKETYDDGADFKHESLHVETSHDFMPTPKEISTGITVMAKKDVALYGEQLLDVAFATECAHQIHDIIACDVKSHPLEATVAQYFVAISDVLLETVREKSRYIEAIEEYLAGHAVAITADVEHASEKVEVLVAHVREELIAA